MDCIALFITVGTESDNARYGGTLTGTSGVLCPLINDRANWSFNNSTPFNITPGSFTTSVTCSGLPVELSAFEAKNENRAVSLMWTTESELNNSGFDVMHSVDGENWTKIGFVEGMGSIQSRTEYAFSDRALDYGQHYYQLIQKDWDGASEASPVRSVSIVSELNQSLLLFPNPASGEFVNLKAEKTVQNVHVFDATLRDMNIMFDAQNQRLNVSQLAEGVYTIIAVTEDAHQYQAVFVKGE